MNPQTTQSSIVEYLGTQHVFLESKVSIVSCHEHTQGTIYAPSLFWTAAQGASWFVVVLMSQVLDNLSLLQTTTGPKFVNLPTGWWQSSIEMHTKPFTRDILKIWLNWKKNGLKYLLKILPGCAGLIHRYQEPWLVFIPAKGESVCDWFEGFSYFFSFSTLCLVILESYMRIISHLVTN